ncbi:hypothetical protein AB0C29_00485 [Actinoplanes sp. NPDC048791]|uniref:hypothetical protein n=1 Tax=Actinoplanes sp. NPDC048791 TaxID=3154623 RepID=UPI003401C181
MTPKRVVLAGLCGAMIAAGMVFAIVNLSAADQVASVASFVLAAVLAGVAVADRHAGRHADRSENPPVAASPPTPVPGGPGDDPGAAGQGDERNVGARGDPGASGGIVNVGPGARAAFDSGMVINGDKTIAKATINYGTRRRWWHRRAGHP